MKKNIITTFQIFLILGVAYFNLSCYGWSPSLTKDLIEDSDLIFEGKLIKADTIPEDDNSDNLFLTFKPIKIFKGEKHRAIILKSNTSSCGFIMNYKYRKRFVGNKFIIYSNKIDGYYRYATSKNRRVIKTPTSSKNYKKYDKQRYKRDIVISDSLYVAELLQLDSILKSDFSPIQR